MRHLLFLFISLTLLTFSCSSPVEIEEIPETTSSLDYFNYKNPDDQFTGGVKMIPISTPKGEFKVWTKRIGNNPSMKVLLLHGGPGITHEFFECFDGYLPKEGIEYIYYDQLGSYYSDQPSDTSLWRLDRFVEEVEQVRKALGLNPDNFYLFGQSWGGILAAQYALKYQDNLKGLIIANMMMSAPDYHKYAHEVLGPAMDPAIYKEIMDLEANNDFENPRYGELLFEHHYTEHILRMPLEDWPESVNRSFNHINAEVYIHMQGYSEFGMTGNATLKNWDVTDQLNSIHKPTLVIGGTHDTMDPEHMEWVAEQLQNGRFLLCPNGSHAVQYDDQKVFFEGLIKFVKDVDSGEF